MTQAKPQNLELRSTDYRHLAELLSTWTGIQLAGNLQLMSGRLRKPALDLGLSRYDDYYDLLRQRGPNSIEGQTFINALTTNKTSFFREAHHFDFLVSSVFASAQNLAHAHQELPKVRLYSAGCSFGAEPYSMALLAAHHLPAHQGWDVRILATDLDTTVLQRAEQGVYSRDILNDIPSHLHPLVLRQPEPDLCRIKPDVAAQVTFAKANMVQTPFPVRGRFDAIFFRNVMIYFDRAMQDQVVASLTNLLVPGGFLVIGHSERIHRADMLRVPVPGVYQKQSSGRSYHPPLRRTSKPTPKPPPPLKRIVVGQWAVCTDSSRVATVLGSCVAACVYDAELGIGGINHFMLPQSDSETESSARFGMQSMELLINGLVAAGARRSKLQAKAFGAAEINVGMVSTVASRNSEFIREFLEREGIELVAERLGGADAREVIFWTGTGQAQVRAFKNPAAIATLKKREITAFRQSTPPTHADF